MDAHEQKNSYDTTTRTARAEKYLHYINQIQAKVSHIVQVSELRMFRNTLYLRKMILLKTASGTGEGRGALQLVTHHYHTIP